MTEIGDLVTLKAFDNPDETRLFGKGRFDIVRIGGATVGRATYQPGWRWSLHVGPAVGASRCEVEHLGYVVGGRGTAAVDDGRIFELIAGSLYHIPAIPHDSWVIGDQTYVSVHLLDATHYAIRS
jgi:hypothetical protein